MADNGIGGGSLPFNISPLKSTVFDRDAEFWRLLSDWRVAEDAFELSPYGGDQPEGVAMLDVATDLRSAMFAYPITTVTGLLAKLEAAHEGGGDCLGIEIAQGGTALDAMIEDCRRISAIELGLGPVVT